MYIKHFNIKICQCTHRSAHGTAHTHSHTFPLCLRSFRCMAHDIIKELLGLGPGRAAALCGSAVFCEWVRGVKSELQRCLCVRGVCPASRLWCWAALPPTPGAAGRRVGGSAGKEEWAERGCESMLRPQTTDHQREELHSSRIRTNFIITGRSS